MRPIPAETMEFAAFLSAELRDADVEMAAGGSPSAGSGSTDGGESSPSARAAKGRKPTYIVRKVMSWFRNSKVCNMVLTGMQLRQEEREGLMKELEELQVKLQKLQEAERDQPPSPPNLLQQELETSLLRDAVRMQQLSLVNVQSAVSGYVVRFCQESCFLSR